MGHIVTYEGALGFHNITCRLTANWEPTWTGKCPFSEDIKYR